MTTPPASARDVLLPLSQALTRIDLHALNSIPNPNGAWVVYLARVLAILSPTGMLQGFPAPLISAGPRASFAHLRAVLTCYTNCVDSMAKSAGLEIRGFCPASCPGATPCPTCSSTPSAPPEPPKTYVDALVGSRPPSPTPGPVAPNPLPKPRSTRKRQRARPAAPASSGLPPKPTTSLPKPQTTATKVTKPVRLITRFGGDPPTTLRGLPQPDLFRLTQSGAKDQRVLGVQWNKVGNIIISFPAGTSHASILAACPTIRTALGIPEPTVMSIDVPWTKLMVSSVPARPDPGAPTYSEADLLSSFLLNPTLQNVAITRQPRWLRNPANIMGAHSSFVFSFEDIDHSISRTLLKTPIFMFGAPVAIKKWRQVPPVAP
ncbi:hypothetical protein BDV93DRAFT_563329 [Ceratobasidium sp. AG-I]|nr:hypothetical protein BDV93DRAFT_563329 [Ceratobasidium sp. AG-I]